MENTEFEAWFASLPAGDHPRDGKEWALEGWEAAMAVGESERNALFGRVTDWVNEHRIPFDAQNELFRILSADCHKGVPGND